MVQTVLHGPLHNRRHALPVQTVLARRSLPTQLARQNRHCIRQRRGHSRPGLGPGKVLHPYPAARALDASRMVAKLQPLLPHRQIAPFPFRSHAVDLPAPLPAYPAAQQPPAQAVDVHDHELFGVRNLGHRVRFQAQLFSDKSFYKHLGPFPSLWFGSQLRRIVGGRGASQEAVNRYPLAAQARRHGRLVVLRGTHNSLMENRLSPVTLLGQEPKKENHPNTHFQVAHPINFDV